MTQGYRQVGKARDSESRMRWFESSYPCQFFLLRILFAVDELNQKLTTAF